MKDIVVGGKVIGKKFGVVLDNTIGVSVIYADNMYHMWYSGEDEKIYYATSVDGRIWSVKSVIEIGNVFSLSVIHNGKKYIMYYSMFDGDNIKIYHATSLDGKRWKKHGVIIDTGHRDDTDGCDASSPSVIYDGKKYHMWYSGFDENSWCIHYAISKKGRVWKKQGIVLDVYSKNKDFFNVESPSVIHDGEVHHMFFIGTDTHTSKMRYAISKDGKVWKKCKTIIDIGNKGDSDCEDICSQAVIKQNNIFKIWYVGFDGNKNRLHYTEVDIEKLKEVI